MPEVREREEHDAAFGVCRARERHEILQRAFRIVLRFIFWRRVLRRRMRLRELTRELA